jgi:hypothetical protein
LFSHLQGCSCSGVPTQQLLASRQSPACPCSSSSPRLLRCCCDASLANPTGLQTHSCTLCLENAIKTTLVRAIGLSRIAAGNARLVLPGFVVPSLGWEYGGTAQDEIWWSSVAFLRGTVRALIFTELTAASIPALSRSRALVCLPLVWDVLRPSLQVLGIPRERAK